MANIKEELKEIKLAISSIERKTKMEDTEIKTIEEFEKVIKMPKVSEGTRSLWRTGKRKPDWKSLEIMYRHGIPLESWFSTEDYQKKLKKESVKRKVENE